MEQEIEENIYKRFPSLGNSPERVSKQSGGRDTNTMIRSKVYNMTKSQYSRNIQKPPTSNTGAMPKSSF